MEDSSQSSRRSRTNPPRPESSASSMTRMTPSSSNSSTTNLPRNTISSMSSRGQGGAGNSLLQERLRERKVESARRAGSSGRRRSIDLSSNRDIQSSPVKGSMGRDERPSSGGVSNTMGAKQIEDQVSTLHKQNFDLKLELYHRRQRQEELEKKIEELERELETRDTEYAEQQDVNDQLLAELEKRDNAVNEAVQVICELEEKVERYENRDREHVKAFDASYEPGYFDHSLNEPSSSPPQYDKSALRPARSVPRMPSFLSETTQNTENLRSLYKPYQNESYSDVGLPQLQEELSVGGDSPRLSVLSESSFVSVYGLKPLPRPLDKIEIEEPRRPRASSAVAKWVEERPIPTITPPVRPQPASIKSQYLSINDILESPLQKLEKLKHRGMKPMERNPSVQDKRQPKELRKVSTDYDRQDQQQALPPTPDTISTNTLRRYQNSYDTLAQDRMKEGTFLNSISALPTPEDKYHAFQSSVSIPRPRSAGETVTSRREGHGWDTPSEALTSDIASLSSNGTYAPLHPRPTRVLTPNLFSFSSNDWGRDMMYNNEPELPAHTRARYQELRRSALEDPKSEDTVTNEQDLGRETLYGTVPIDTTPKPDIGDRRSSLSATTKVRKSINSSVNSGSNSNSPATATASPPVSIPPPTHKNRFSTLGLFRRSETSPATTPTQSSFQSSIQTARNKQGRTQSCLDNTHSMTMEDEQARATPPPIKRSRGQGQGTQLGKAEKVLGKETPVVGSYRPSSAGVGAMRKDGGFEEGKGMGGRVRRGSLNTGSSSVPPVSGALGLLQGTGEEDGVGGGKGEKKKWFGLGRAGSLRRN